MESDIECGLGKCHPAWLQRFRSIACFTAVFGVSTCFTSSLIFYVSSQITALEKQFGFSSLQSGVLLSCNEVGFILTCLIVSFFARKVHIPRVLAISTFVTGLCGIFASVAYYITPKDHLYDVKGNMAVNLSTDTATVNQIGQLCKIGVINRTAPHTQLEHCKMNQSQEGGLSTNVTNTAFAIIAIGMFIGGIAKSPRDPFSTTYIDDNVHKTKTAMYVGVLGSVGIFGPALGFGLGGIFSKIYVTLEDVYISPEDRRWVGAWWLGFVVFGCLSILSAIPTLFFPRRFHPVQEKTLKKRSNEHKTGIVSSIKEFCKSVLRLFKNPIYVLLVLSSCIDLFNVSGWIAFEPKYMETQYNIPAWRANLYIGIVSVVPAGLGCLIGGIITSKFKLSPLSCAKFLVGGVIACILLPLLSLFLGCSNTEIVGYQNEMTTTIQTLRNSTSNGTNAVCSDSCDCDKYSFSPVCGEDGINYFSPCLAGCKEFDKEIYSMCACVMNQTLNGTAVSGLCKSECTMMWPYLILNLVFGFFITVYLIPVTMLFMRCVSEEDKAMALGMLAFLTTLTGWFPGPVVFGKIVDSCCIIWTTGCEHEGACSQYDIEKFRYRRNILSIILYAVMILLAFVIHALSKRKTDWSTEDTFNSANEEDLPEADRLMKNQESRESNTNV